MVIASCISLNGNTVNTGPKTSSCANGCSGGTLSITVGLKNFPWHIHH